MHFCTEFLLLANVLFVDMECMVLSTLSSDDSLDYYKYFANVLLAIRSKGGTNHIIIGDNKFPDFGMLNLIFTARPSLRGSCPLDVAYSSLMDNNELALALREAHLEKIAMYLSRCGLQSNSELLEKGYPDIGWDPVEGERYLDFFRFCVWVRG
jgi:hypothetical protein